MDLFRTTYLYQWAGVYRVGSNGRETPMLMWFVYNGNGEWYPNAITSGPHKNCSRMPVGMPIGTGLPNGDRKEIINEDYENVGQR